MKYQICSKATKNPETIKKYIDEKLNKLYDTTYLTVEMLQSNHANYSGEARKTPKKWTIKRTDSPLPHLISKRVLKSLIFFMLFFVFEYEQSIFQVKNNDSFLINFKS